MFEQSSDIAIARQSAKLDRGRRQLLARQRGLHHDTLELCKRPPTLCVALLTGAVAARIGPFAHATQTTTSGDDAAPTKGHTSTVLRTILISGLSAAVRHVISPV